MLASLYIENIAVVRRAEIELGGGLTVLTGETGAGKSVIIDSIRLLMGARAQKEQIRRGENSATVAGLFRDLSQDAVRALAEIGIEPDENGEPKLQSLFLNFRTAPHLILRFAPQRLSLMRQSM